MILLIATLACCTQISSTRSVKLFLSDQDGKPVRASVAVLNSEPVASATVEPVLLETNSDGTIELACSSESVEDKCCFLYAKGYAIDLLSLQNSTSRSLKITMLPESDLDVIVVDQHGAPIQGARVTPGRIHFRESAWIANAPFRLPEYLESTTDKSGHAKLHGVIAEQLSSVRVSFGNRRGCAYQIPDRRDKGSAITIESNPVFGSLLCKLRDANGEPVANARVFAETSEEYVNPLTLREPTPLFSEYLGRTGIDGNLSIEDVPVGILDIRFFSNDQRIGVGKHRKDFEIKPNRVNELEHRFEATSPVIVGVIDADTGAGLSDVTIRCQLIEKGEYIIAFAKTNEDGIAEFDVQAGEWEFSLEDESLPKGYCVLYPDHNPKKSISESKEIQVGPSILITKGTRIDGEIRGINLEEIRNNWISAENKEARWTGRFFDDGTFTMVVPNDVQELGFQIATGHRKGRLKLESKSPWILNWVEQEK